MQSNGGGSVRDSLVMRCVDIVKEGRRPLVRRNTTALTMRVIARIVGVIARIVRVNARIVASVDGAAGDLTRCDSLSAQHHNRNTHHEIGRHHAMAAIGSVDTMLRSIAKEHAVDCKSVTRFAVLEGWLCSRCDADFDTYAWKGDPEEFHGV